MIRKRGVKTVLWGCSVEPSMINNTMAKDLLAYDLIVARESITYEALKNLGTKVVLCPDPAFQMQPQICDIPFKKTNGDIIGINISPHIMTCENGEGIAYQNYKELIKYILEETDYQIALIPHVVWESNDDRKVLRKLYEDFGENNRLIMIEDHTAPELKYLISKCDMFIGARTHATIAAYSSCVPTLVVGYSVKARGIAKDLFGAEENYVIPVQSLEKPNDLVNGFKWLEENNKQIREHLMKMMTEYSKSSFNAKEKIMSLI